MAYCRPQSHLRQAPLALGGGAGAGGGSEAPPSAAAAGGGAAAAVAVLFIDVQNFNCHRRGACFAQTAGDGDGGGGADSAEYQYWWQRLAETIPRWQQLQQACRQARGCEVMYTVIQSLTRDGRDRGLDYKISGFHVPPGSWDGQLIDELLPGTEDEIMLPKTSSSVFISTNLHYLLQALGPVRQLILAGCVTDQCVAHAVKDACDLGYLVTLVTDCCATYSQERHDAALAMVAGYCRQRTLDQLLPELAAGAAA